MGRPVPRPLRFRRPLRCLAPWRRPADRRRETDLARDRAASGGDKVSCRPVCARSSRTIAGRAPGASSRRGEPREGRVAVPLSRRAPYTTRICRAVRLSDQERGQATAFMIRRGGLRYELRDVLARLRDFGPRPPVPVRRRRRPPAFGSGDPSRAICPSLTARAFRSVRYPILPDVTVRTSRRAIGRPARQFSLPVIVRPARPGISTCRPISRP